MESNTPFTKYEMAVPDLSLFEQRLANTFAKGQVNVLCPAGTGDNLWNIYKLWNLCQEREVVFWLPAEEQHRSGDVFRMMGLPYGYMPGLSTNWVWSRPGSPAIPDTGGVISIQANRHLEHGHRIEKWYPEWEGRNPVQFMECGAQIFAERKYVVGFMSQIGYMEHGGNLKPAQWARIWKQVERDVAPVLLIGADKDVAFAEEVMKYWTPCLQPVFNAPYDQVAAILSGAEMVVGVASGPLILATYMGIPTMHAYPRWLAPMVGTWELADATWGACFLDQIENVVREGIRFEGMDCMGRMRAETRPIIQSFGTRHSRWRPEPPVMPASDTENVSAERNGYSGIPPWEVDPMLART